MLQQWSYNKMDVLFLQVHCKNTIERCDQFWVHSKHVPWSHRKKSSISVLTLMIYILNFLKQKLYFSNLIHFPIWIAYYHMTVEADNIGLEVFVCITWFSLYNLNQKKSYEGFSICSEVSCVQCRDSLWYVNPTKWLKNISWYFNF